jgi:hypothetical protein
MRSSLIAVSVFIQAALAGACLSRAAENPPSIGYFEAIAQEAAPVVGETYYMRHCIMHEKGEHVATNYWKGALTAINTKVKLVAMKGNTIKLQVVDTGEEIKVVNVADYTKKDLSTIARNMLTRTPVPIEQFGEEMVANIRNGRLVRGMTREQVVMTRGYPPGHRTSSLDNDVWTYWINRVANFPYTFANGRLAEGRGLD